MGDKVDLWNTTRNTGFLFEPLSVALLATGRLDLRRLTNAAASASRSPGVPSLGVPALRPSFAGMAAYPAKALRSRNAVRQFYYDGARRLVHVTMASPLDLIYLPPAKEAGAVVLMTIHDATQHPGEENLALRLIMRRVQGMADHLVAVSSFVAEELKRSGSVRQPIHVVPNGLLEELDAPATARTAPRDRPLRLLFHGRIKHYKGVDLLIEAMKLLPAMGVSAELTIAGAGDTDQHVQAAAGLPNVTFIPRRTTDEERRDLYATHDVNMLPYREASQSGVALRGLFAAQPSIATRVGALPEQLTEGQDSLFTEAISSQAIAEKIKAVAINPQLYATLSKGARTAALTHSPDLIADRWVSLYRQVLNQSRSSDRAS